MAQYQHLPIYKLSYDLVLRTSLAIKDFPRDFKYTLGQKLKQEVIDLVLHVYRANSAKQKSAHITEFLERLQLIEMMLRLSHDLKILARTKYVDLVAMTDKLGRQAQGWLKHETTKTATASS